MRPCRLPATARSESRGVPAAAAALLIATGEWDVKRMANVEQLPPRPFLELLGRMGLPSRVQSNGQDVAVEVETELIKA